ncbi:MAG: acyltransferase family protein [Beijerinckiaceae bacterium]
MGARQRDWAAADRGPPAAAHGSWTLMRAQAKVTGAESVTTTDEGHLPVLDGLRALSILLVLATHLLPLGPKTLKLNAMAGAMGMCLFFALSGFLIVRTLAQSTVLEFAVRRLARLLPLAWLYIAVVALLYPISGEALQASLGLWLNFRPDLMLPVTEHLWSLGVEIHFYIVAALLALMHRKAILAVWLLCICVTALRIAEGAHLAIATHLRADEILIGACVATLSLRWLQSLAWLRWIWPAAAVAWVVTSHPDTGWLQFFRPYVTGLLLAATLVLPEGDLRRILSSAVARYIATISYALYVIHPLFAHGWWNAGMLAERYLLKRPMGIALTFLLAHLSTFWWERFWIKLAARKLADRKANAQAPASVPLEQKTPAPS